MSSDRFARFLPLAGVLAGLLLAGGLTLTYSIPSSETSFEETFAWWKDNRGQHQISGLLLAPLVALMLVFFGAGLAAKPPKRQPRLRSWFGGVRRGDPRRCGVRTHRRARRCSSERSARGPSGGRLRAQPTPFVRLADIQCSLGGRIARHWSRRASQRNAAELACLGDHRPWGDTVDPIGFLGSLFIPPWLIVVGIWLFWKSKAAVPVVGLGEDEVAVSTS